MVIVTTGVYLLVIPADSCRSCLATQEGTQVVMHFAQLLTQSRLWITAEALRPMPLPNDIS